MTLDERLKALAMSTELLSHDVEALRTRVETDAAATAASIRELRATIEIDANSIQALARIAENSRA